MRMDSFNVIMLIISLVMMVYELRFLECRVGIIYTVNVLDVPKVIIKKFCRRQRLYRNRKRRLIFWSRN